METPSRATWSFPSLSPCNISRDHHEVSQMTEFHLLQVCPMGMLSQATRYFCCICLAVNWNGVNRNIKTICQYCDKRKDRVYGNPDSGPVGDLQELVHQDPAAFLLARQRR